MVPTVDNILNAAQKPQLLTPQPKLIPEPAKVSGIWDSIESTLTPRNEVTGKRNLMLLPKKMEQFIGDFTYPFLIAGQGGKSFNLEKNQLVEQVKNQLLPFIRREFDWDIQLVSSKSVNAAALPGGKIIICEGIIDKMMEYLRTNMDEIQENLSAESVERQSEVLGKELQSMLAAVIGHEIAHSDIGHTRSKIQTMIVFYVLLFITYIAAYAVFLGTSNRQSSNKKGASVLEQCAQFFYRHLFNIGFRLYQLAQSRGNEYEADAIGMQVYMREAGFDLNGAVRLMDMFSKMKETGHDHSGMLERIQEIFSTHPLSHNRKVQAEEIRDRVRRLSAAPA